MNSSARRHRIALVGPLPPYRGGIAHFTTTLLRHLHDRGHEVLGVNFSRQYPDLLFPGKTQFEEGEVEVPAPTHRWLDSVGPWSWWRTGRRIRAWKPDAVIYAYWMPFFGPAFGSVLRAAGRRDVRHIGLDHNAIPHEHRPGDRILGNWFLRACDAHLVLSEEVERDLRSLGVRATIERRHHPIYDLFGDPVPREVARRRLDVDDDARTLLFFGYVRPYKGLDVLVEALARCRTERLELFVVGEFYEGEEATRARIAELGLGDRVRLQSGYVPTDEVSTWFGAADVVVQPYVTASQSGVAQVAFQCEKPLILTDVGGLAEIVPDGEAGLVVPPSDPGALAAAIDRFFEKGLAERLTEGVLRQRKRFSWDALVDALEGLLAPE